MLRFTPSRRALTIDEFERQGNCFQSDIDIITSPEDTAAAEWTQHVLDTYADKVLAYCVSPLLGADTFVIQLQFDGTMDGRATARECLKEYRKGFGKGGHVPRRKRELNAEKERDRRKRLPKQRMYRLKDGQLFWYYARWDRHGNLTGKVESTDRPHQGGIPLENKIIHRSVLEQADLIPKGEEPWVLE